MMGTPQPQDMLQVCVQEDIMHFPLTLDRCEARMKANPMAGWDGKAEWGHYGGCSQQVGMG